MIIIAVVGATLLAVLLLTGRDNARLERDPPPHTASTRTSQIMTDDDTLVRKLAERYLEAVDTHDDATIAELNCVRAAPGLIQIAAAGRPVTMTGLERARAQEWYYLHLAIGGEPGGSRRIVKRDGTWCVED